MEKLDQVGRLFMEQYKIAVVPLQDFRHEAD
jgi:hypothetical protein